MCNFKSGSLNPLAIFIPYIPQRDRPFDVLIGLIHPVKIVLQRFKRSLGLQRLFDFGEEQLKAGFTVSRGKWCPVTQ